MESLYVVLSAQHVRRMWLSDGVCQPYPRHFFKKRQGGYKRLLGYTILS